MKQPPRVKSRSWAGMLAACVVLLSGELGRDNLEEKGGCTAAGKKEQCLKALQVPGARLRGSRWFSESDSSNLSTSVQPVIMWQMSSRITAEWWGGHWDIQALHRYPHLSAELYDALDHTQGLTSAREGSSALARLLQPNGGEFLLPRKPDTQ